MLIHIYSHLPGKTEVIIVIDVVMLIHISIDPWVSRIGSPQVVKLVKYWSGLEGQWLRHLSRRSWMVITARGAVLIGVVNN